MSTPSSSYAETLVSQGYGLPLWFPEPGKQGDVEIGDVGFVNEGRFIRLFNAMLSATDPVNARGVPDDFTVLDVDDEGRRLESHSRLVPMGSVSTASVHYEHSLQTDTSDRKTSHRFSWSGQRGAVAIILDSGVEQVVTGEAVRQYIHRHHASWYAFARREKYDLKEEEIILVYGCMKTSGWALATFNRSKRDGTKAVSFCAVPRLSTGDIFTFDRISNPIISVDQRSGPDWSTDRAVQQFHATISHQPKDQTLFLKYYKLKRRRPLGYGPPILDELNPARTIHACYIFSGVASLGSRFHGLFLRKKFEAEEISYEEHQDPLNDALSYILKHSSADIAIVSHDDLYRVCSKPSEWPSDVSKHLNRFALEVATDQYGGTYAQRTERTQSKVVKGNNDLSVYPSFGLHILSSSPQPVHKSASADRVPAKSSNIVAGSDVPSDASEQAGILFHGRMKPFPLPVAEETEGVNRPSVLPIEAVSESTGTTQILPASPDDVFSDAQLASRFGLTYSPETGMRRGTAETSKSADSRFSSGAISEKGRHPVVRDSETAPGCICAVM